MAEVGRYVWLAHLPCQESIAAQILIYWKRKGDKLLIKAVKRNDDKKEQTARTEQTFDVVRQCFSTFLMSWPTFHRDFVLGPTS